MALYQPNPAAVPTNVSFVRLLTTRDLSLNIPINFVSQPGVALTAACFAHGRYESQPATKCFSNLLVMGYRRLYVDIFWDYSRNVWSFCPVQLGAAGEEGSQTTTASSTSHVSVATKLSSVSTVAKRAEYEDDFHADVVEVQPTARAVAPVSNSEALQLPNAQTQSSSANANSTSVAITATLLPSGSTASVAGQPSATSVPAGAIIETGPYLCSTDMNISVLAQIVQDYMYNTQNNLNSTTYSINLNIHAAASASNPSGSAPAPPTINLPQGDSLVGAILNGYFSDFIYTPSELLTQRANLNTTGSYFSVAASSQPNPLYFHLDDNNGHLSTPDGWPSEGFMELEQGKRVLVGVASVDPQMSAYNFSGDASVIFPLDYLEDRTAIATDAQGDVISGCFYNSAVTNLTQVNSSWAYSQIGFGQPSDVSALSSTLTQALGMTRCGIAPILNATLNNVTADTSIGPYFEFVQNTVWSWGPGEPLNSSANSGFASYRCAALNSTSGTWEASSCQSYYYGACRGNNGPYDWSISGLAVPYGRVDLACPSNTYFDLPRTALENAYLLSTWKSYQSTHDDDAGPLLWVDFNDLDVSSCWVIGTNTTCPYQNSIDTASREVAVPVVAAIIVFVLAALTMLVKCAGNRRNTKRKRRRGGDGWDYEGVPQ